MDDLLDLNGHAAMMYVGEEPWHGQGTKLDRPATAKEAIEAAGLNWRVEKKPLCYWDGSQAVTIPQHYAVVPGEGWRGDTRPVLGTVGDRFQLLQNHEAFTFFDPIVGKNAAVYHTAGALGQGERIWILANLPGELRVIGDDITHKYLLLSNSHDGRSAVHVTFTPIRVVCRNTLNMALRDSNQRRALRIPHTHDMRERLAQADRLMGIVEKTYTELNDVYQAMTRVQMSGHALRDYFVAVFPSPVDPENESGRARAATQRRDAVRHFEQGRGTALAGVPGTLWAVYNAVTEYVDHRPTKSTPTRRLASVWFGEGARIKVRAFDAARQLLPT